MLHGPIGWWFVTFALVGGVLGDLCFRSPEEWAETPKNAMSAILCGALLGIIVVCLIQWIL